MVTWKINQNFWRKQNKNTRWCTKFDIFLNMLQSTKFYITIKIITDNEYIQRIENNNIAILY